MPPKSQLSKLVSDLQALATQLSEVSDVEDALERGKADLKSLNDARAQAQSDLTQAEGLLTRAQADAQRRFDQDMYNKQGALKSLTERIEALQEQAKELTEEVRTKGLQLQSIESAFNDARRRLAG